MLIMLNIEIEVDMDKILIIKEFFFPEYLRKEQGFFFAEIFNSLPNNKILYLAKLKYFTDDKTNVT